MEQWASELYSHLITSAPQAHLVQYLQGLSQLSFFCSAVRPHLKPHELHTLQTVGVNIN